MSSVERPTPEVEHSIVVRVRHVGAADDAAREVGMILDQYLATAEDTDSLRSISAARAWGSRFEHRYKASSSDEIERPSTTGQ